MTNRLPHLSTNDRHFLFRPFSLPSYEVKEIGGKWDSKLGVYRLPKLSFSLHALRRLYGEELDRELDSEIRTTFLDGIGFDLRPIESFENVRYDDLYDWQRRGVQYLLSSPHRGSLLGLSPGLGKSATLIRSSYQLQPKRVLVVVPLPLLRTWETQLQRWGSDINYERTHQRGPSSTAWNLTNYDTIRLRLQEYLKVDWDLIIADESILVKTRDSNRTEALFELGKKSRKIWLASGAPTSRYIDDLFAQFRILSPESFTSYWRFVSMYCVTTTTPWGQSIVGSKPGIDFRKEFSDLAFILNKSEVSLDLPDVQFELLELEMSGEQLRIYNDIKKTFLAQLDTGEEISSASKMSQLLRLLQCVSTPYNFGEGWPKISSKIDGLITSVRMSERPMIVWTHWRKTAELLHESLRKEFPDLTIEFVIGGDSLGEEKIKKYEDGKIDILILSLGVGKYGLTLTRTKTVIYYDKFWDSDAYLQSLERVHRIGLTHSPVSISLQMSGTVDILIVHNLENKLRSMARMTNHDLASLLRSLR